MKLTTLFPTAALILAVSVLSMPMDEAVTDLQERSTSSNPDNVSMFAEGDDKCSGSAFYSETSSGSPWAEDCLDLAQQFDEKSESFSVGSTRIEIARKGNRRFMALSTSEGAVVGNTDARDVIQDSYNKFMADRKLGARGSMACQSRDEGPDRRDQPVDWWIWKT
ncbi:hypothetical protein CC79DRAFT_1324660 [Sarocladium strictum]